MTDIKQENGNIQPGPCPIVNGVQQCPPPTQIDIIKVTKVFEECMHAQVEQVEIEIEIEPESGLTAECGGVTITSSECSVINGNIIRYNAELEVTTNVNGETGTGTIEIERYFQMARAGDPALTPQCQIFPECLMSYISDEGETSVTVTCCVGVLILLRLEAEVQLMVPSYGYPPEPGECELIDEKCPAQYDPVWPPYPQLNGNNNSSNFQSSLFPKSCKGKCK